MTATRLGKASGAKVTWEDAATGDRGWIGHLEDHEIVPVVDALFRDLRTWRERCAQPQPAEKAMGVGA